MNINYDENTKSILSEIPTMTDDKLLSLAREYSMACEMMEYRRQNDGPEYWNCAERYNAAITECKKRHLSTRGL